MDECKPLVLGQAKHLGAISKLSAVKAYGRGAGDGRRATGGAGPEVSSRMCSESVCHTCVRVAEETLVVVQCGDDQEIIDFADAAWGVAMEQPSWRGGAGSPFQPTAHRGRGESLVPLYIHTTASLSLSPCQPTLKAPGTKRLKLRYDELLSTSTCAAT